MEANLERKDRKECRKEKKKSMEKEKMTKKRKTICIMRCFLIFASLGIPLF